MVRCMGGLLNGCDVMLEKMIVRKQCNKVNSTDKLLCECFDQETIVVSIVRC